MNSKERHEQAAIYHNLGVASHEQNNWAQAEEYYKKALKINIELDDRYAQAGTYHQLGKLASQQEQTQQAKEYCQKALSIYKEFNEGYEQADTYHLLGLIELEQMQWGQARLNLFQALPLYLENRDIEGIMKVLRCLAILWKADELQDLHIQLAESLEMSTQQLIAFFEQSFEEMNEAKK